MESGVFLLNDDNSLIRMDPQPYDAEQLLQELLSNHSELLAGDQINPESPRRFLLIQPEIGVPDAQDAGMRWFLDHLFIDQDAIPTFVEVKRATDTRIRREVVAQMLDYAANATEYWPIDGIRSRFVAHCERQGLNSEEVIQAFLEPGSDVETFWENVKENLADGRVRLLFVADEIPLSLRRIVEFLNLQMSPAEVLAVEVRQFAPSDGLPLRTLVPRVIGQSEQARQHKPRSSQATTTLPVRAIDQDEFVAACDVSVQPVVEGILAIVSQLGCKTTPLARGENAWVSLDIPGVPGHPIYFDRTHLWVSLGRHHPALRDAAINQRLRAAALKIIPKNLPARDPAKTELGLRFDQFEPGFEFGVRELFTATSDAYKAKPESDAGSHT